MKWIKSINELNESIKEYTQIPEDEYDSLLFTKKDGHLYADKVVNLTPYEISILNDLDDEKIFRITGNEIRFSLLDYNTNDEIDLRIDKVEDEWFLVMMWRHSNIFYKCDQFDGLLTFLKNVKKSCSRWHKWDELM